MSCGHDERRPAFSRRRMSSVIGGEGWYETWMSALPRSQQAFRSCHLCDSGRGVAYRRQGLSPLTYRPANRIRPLPYDCGSIPTRSASDVQRLGSPLDTWVGKDPMQPFRRRCRTASMRSVPIRGFQGISGGIVKRQGGWAVVERGKTEGALSKWCARQDLNL